MRIKLRFLCLHILFLMIFMCGCTKNKRIDRSSIKEKMKTAVNNNIVTDKISNMPIEQAVIIDDPNCVEFVALWSSGDIAESIGKDKKWVFLNYTIDLWDNPPTYIDGNVVGKLRASSYARIIATMGEDYKVESPVGKVQGWISNEHVKTISKKNPRTRALCE